MATEPTRPEPARPLTDRERAVLAEIAAELRRTPGRAEARGPQGRRPGRAQLARPESPRPGASRPPGPRTRAVVEVVVVVVLAVVLMPTVWVGAVLAVVVLVGPLAATWWARHRGGG